MSGPGDALQQRPQLLFFGGVQIGPQLRLGLAQPAEAGAAPIVRAARFTAADPTGTFLDATGVSPW
ncbi:hypothetical protein [Amycolatopsis sp. NPDC051716]|uniref:hypothetical protein n=1 Tax=Amycolatopsis sp. NPDC051716 TaxID=3155804 RepID=UPI003419C863